MKERPPYERGALALFALILFQMASAVFFLVDAGGDLLAIGLAAALQSHLGLEMLATLALVAGIAVEVVTLRRMLARAARADRAVSIARGALTEVFEGYFREWGLTPAEADVASFTLKGFSIAEIAGFRGSAEGTVKTHLNAIYRKAGVSGRGQLVSLLIEDLMRNPLVEVAERDAGPPPAAVGTNSPPAASGPATAGAQRP